MKTSMTSTERRAVFSLSSIIALRMMGLFMVLPVFSVYASELKGATPALVGLAMGIYGLSQALFQVPFGTLSDRFGRKPLILTGLFLFIAGSLLAGFADSMITMIVARTLQGIGAIGSTIMAFMADLTREEQRTKSMAIAGITIGCSFSIAMFLGPVLVQWFTVSGLFLLAALFGFICILILFLAPSSSSHPWQRDSEPELKSFFRLLLTPELAKLNLGIFILHTIFTASFIAIPIGLQEFFGLKTSEQWELYLPALLSAFVLALFCIGIAERNQQIKIYFTGGIAAICVAEILLWSANSNILLASSGICLFFAGFSLLEAFLPSLVSRTAPVSRKGSALGIYSSSQFLGIFVGGVFGGWLFGQFSYSGVYLFCISLSLLWLALASSMQPACLIKDEKEHCELS